MWAMECGGSDVIITRHQDGVGVTAGDACRNVTLQPETSGNVLPQLTLPKGEHCPRVCQHTHTHTHTRTHAHTHTHTHTYTYTYTYTHTYTHTKRERERGIHTLT